MAENIPQALPTLGTEKSSLYRLQKEAAEYRQILEDNQLKLSELWEKLDADPEFGNNHWISRVIVEVVMETRRKIGPVRPSNSGYTTVETTVDVDSDT